MFSALRRRLPRVGRLPRLCAAGCCLLLAVNSAAEHGRAARAPRSAPVVVAARDLPAGHVLAPADLRVVRWPSALRPPTARADPGGVAGRRLASPLPAGEPVTGARLVGRDLSTGLPVGMVAAPVLLADPHAAELVHAGDHVDLLASARPAEVPDPRPSGEEPVRTLAPDALVLACFGADDGAGTELVLAVARPVALDITRQSGTHVFTAVVGPP